MKNLLDQLRQMLRRNAMPILCTGVVLTLLIAFLWPSMFITVKSGEKGVLYSRLFGGTVLDKIYDEGMHIIFPWDIMSLYDVRIQEMTEDIDVLTLDGLTITAEISIRYQLMRDMVPSLHQDIGPDYRSKIVKPIMIGAVRQTIGKYKLEALYSIARQKLQDQMLVDAIEEMGRTPILINAFVVKTLVLPEVLTKAIEEKLVAEQRYLRYDYLLLEAKAEAKRKAIEGEGIRFYQSLVNENMTNGFLRYEGIKATTKLAESKNAKVVVVGGKDGLPLILNTPEEREQKGMRADVNAGAGDGVCVPAHGGPQPPEAPAPAKPAAPPENAASTRASQPGWHPSESEFMKFIERLDATLLNPNPTTPPSK